MPKNAENILADALELPPIARAELVENLLSSFEFQGRNVINALWAHEAEDRIDAFERGEITAIHANDIFNEIEKTR
ncbi:MAG TPA: addiction module protein [Smithella sp.]|nr:addiction module protein [Smithella sp.]HOG91432.1 addiction module protein [Smithella sp.]